MASKGTLARQMARCTRQFAMISAVDQLCDSEPTLDDFLRTCAHLIEGDFHPDLCHLLTIDEDGTQELRIALERWAGLPSELPEQLVDQAVRTGFHVEVRHNGGALHCWPLIIGAETFGALLLGRASGGFDEDEIAVLEALISRVDSALKQLRTLHNLRCRQRELEAIYQIDHLLDTTPDFNLALHEALRILSSSISAELSFIMLYANNGTELELRAASHDDLADLHGPLREQVRQLADRTISAGQMLLVEHVSPQIGSYIGLPLILKEQIIGVFGGICTQSGAFGRDEIAMLRAIGSQMDTAVFEDREQQHIRQTFARYVSPAVVDLMLRTPDQDYLRVTRQTITMLFSDMRGFTTMSQQLDPGAVGQMLNEHLAAMTEIIRRAGGTVDKFVGDEVVAFWGAPVHHANDAHAAVLTALAMQRRHEQLMQSWRERGLPAVPIGIGISSGEVVVGNIGSAQMMNYTAIGPDMNLAARLCSAAGAGQVLISQHTAALVGNDFELRELPPLALRHIDAPVIAYEVIG